MRQRPCRTQPHALRPVFSGGYIYIYIYTYHISLYVMVKEFAMGP